MKILRTCFDECKYSQHGKEGIRVQYFVIPINILDFLN